ncbi:MAG: hypothetical protein Q9194_000371 [Teloschistes cf. exilis]
MPRSVRQSAIREWSRRDKEPPFLTDKAVPVANSNNGPSSSKPSSPAPSTHSLSFSSAHWTTNAANLTVVCCLSQPSPPRPALPLEIIFQILAHPTRWVQTHHAASPPVRVSDAQRPIVLLGPFTAEQVTRMRQILFRVRSKDQGFSWDRQNHGTFAGSWTWFEAIVRKADEHDQDSRPTLMEHHWGPPNDEHVKKRFELQRNRHAGTQLEDYEVVLSEGDERMTEVKNVLREGDVFEVRACAAFPAWENQVDYAELGVWSLDNLRKSNEVRPGSQATRADESIGQSWS